MHPLDHRMVTRCSVTIREEWVTTCFFVKQLSVHVFALHFKNQTEILCWVTRKKWVKLKTLVLREKVWQKATVLSTSGWNEPRGWRWRWWPSRGWATGRDAGADHTDQSGNNSQWWQSGPWLPLQSGREEKREQILAWLFLKSDFMLWWEQQTSLCFYSSCITAVISWFPILTLN